MSRSTKVKKTTSKTQRSGKSAPEHIKMHGYVYERTSKNCVNVELDLAEDVLQKIDARVNRGEFVSRGDAIRHILRKVIESSNPIE